MRNFLVALCIAALIVVGSAFAINGFVCATTASSIKTEQELANTADSFNAQAIVVLGASINYDGTPSTILQDRLDIAISLYEAGVAPKIIMSGDNSEETYNEVMAMCKYAISEGVPARDIFCDHAGVSTYDSMYRIRHVFGAQRCVVVTQEYHLYRTIYDAGSFGVTAQGCASDLHEYRNMQSFEQREFFARIKDFFQIIVNTEPAVKSEPVSLDQSGTVTQWW